MARNHTITEENGSPVVREVLGPPQEKDPRVGIYDLEGDVAEKTREALAAFDLKGIVSKGDRVAVKVNLGGGIYKAPATYTDPLVVEGIVRACLDRGARPLLCEGSMRTHTATPRLARRRELGKLIDREGIPFVNLSDVERVEFRPADGTMSFPIPKFFLDPDVRVVSATVPKHHWECGVTLSQKNLYGAIAERKKGIYHRDPKTIDPVVAAAARAMRPDLVVLGGRWIGGSLGPHFCVPIDFRRLVVSNDMLAADARVSEVLAYPFELVRHAQVNLRGERLRSRTMPGSVEIPREVYEKCRRYGMPEAKRKFWKFFLLGQYYMPHWVQYELMPPLEFTFTWLNQAFFHTRGDGLKDWRPVA